MRYLKLAKHSKSSYKELKFVKSSVQRLFYHFMSSSLRFVEHTALKTQYSQIFVILNFSNQFIFILPLFKLW